MTTVILDIGAGDLSFAKDLRSNNRDKDLLIFCGEPEWSTSLLTLFERKPITQDNATELIAKGKTGIYKIDSTYSSFALNDSSLDMVTLNSPHPLLPPKGIDKEVNRCLKTGGVFFFGHSTKINLELPDNFRLAYSSLYTIKGFMDTIRPRPFDLAELMVNDYPKNLPNVLTPSPIIHSNILEYYFKTKDPNHKNGYGKSYVYNNIPLLPNFKVWIKNK